MEDKKTCASEETGAAQPLQNDELTQVAGGFSHGHLSDYTCRKCGLELPDAGSYFEHQKMAHGG